jgi:hypothetical protein
MSAFGGKADIIQEKADIRKCPLMTQHAALWGDLSDHHFVTGIRVEHSMNAFLHTTLDL